MTNACEPNEEQALLDQLYAAVGEGLLRERREEAAQEAREHE